MMQQAMVAWAQCKTAQGQLKLFTGWADQKAGETFDEAIAEAVVWKDEVKTTFSDLSQNISTMVMTATNSGTSSGEHIPRPWLHGEMSLSYQWEKMLTVTGFVNVYGISISALPDPASPPTPPPDPTGPMGSIVLQTATYNPPDLFLLGDIAAPRFDFAQVFWQGLTDKPVTPMAVPWTIIQDSYCFPSQFETQSWNVNIPIAKHLLPPAGLSIWGYWSSITLPRLKVKLITAPI